MSLLNKCVILIAVLQFTNASTKYIQDSINRNRQLTNQFDGNEKVTINQHQYPINVIPIQSSQVHYGMESKKDTPMDSNHMQDSLNVKDVDSLGSKPKQDPPDVKNEIATTLNQPSPSTESVPTSTEKDNAKTATRRIFFLPLAKGLMDRYQKYNSYTDKIPTDTELKPDVERSQENTQNEKKSQDSVTIPKRAEPSQDNKCCKPDNKLHVQDSELGTKTITIIEETKPSQNGRVIISKPDNGIQIRGTIKSQKIITVIEDENPSESGFVITSDSNNKQCQHISASDKITVLAEGESKSSQNDQNSKLENKNMPLGVPGDGLSTTEGAKQTVTTYNKAHVDSTHMNEASTNVQQELLKHGTDSNQNMASVLKQTKPSEYFVIQDPNAIVSLTTGNLETNNGEIQTNTGSPHVNIINNSDLQKLLTQHGVDQIIYHNDGHIGDIIKPAPGDIVEIIEVEPHSRKRRNIFESLADTVGISPLKILSPGLKIYNGVIKTKTGAAMVVDGIHDVSSGVKQLVPIG